MDKLTAQFLDKICETIEYDIQLDEFDLLEFLVQMYSLYKGKNSFTGEAVVDSPVHDFIISKLNILYDFYTKETMNKPNAFTLGVLWAGVRFLDVMDIFDKIESEDNQVVTK